MTIDPKRRAIDLSVEVPGTPETVWEAIATGPGISSWFIPCTVDEREGGDVIMDFGPAGQAPARVTVWDPPNRVVFQDAGRPIAYEWLVEARDGGSCIVRLVNSGFGEGADWDAEFDGMTEGWKIFMRNLRLHLSHFAGQPVRTIVPMGVAEGPNHAAFATLCDALGVPDDLSPGDSFVAAGPGVPELRGRVHDADRKPRVSTYHLLLDAPSPGTAFVAAEGDGDKVGVSIYLYLRGDAGMSVTDAWTPLFRERFPLGG